MISSLCIWASQGIKHGAGGKISSKQHQPRHMHNEAQLLATRYYVIIEIHLNLAYFRKSF